MTWIVRAQMNWGWGEYDLRIANKNFDGTIDVVQPFVLKHYERNVYVEEITIKADFEGISARDFLQAAVDCAAEIGIFPSTKPLHTKEVEAVRYHLEDMRKLVFKG